MKTRLTLEPLSLTECEVTQGGNGVSRWMVSTVSGGAFYDGIKSGASSASTAWNSMGAFIIGSHFKQH